MTTVARGRKGGRPKGSRNKNKLLTGKSVEAICTHFKHHPTEFLVRVAKGETIGDFVPTHADQYAANQKLHDGIHNIRKVPGAFGGETIDGQYTLVFEESSDAFTLPGAANAAGTEEAMRGQPVQRASDSPASGEDGICDQQADS